jgi:CHC2 zinc finger
MTETIDMLYMPSDLKMEFCLGLLEEAGADKISVHEDRGEIITCCVMPWHNEKRPSAAINFEKMVYRCLGCDSKGGILWLIGTIKGVYGPEARNWLSEQTGLGGREFQLGPLLQFLDSIEEAQRRTKTPQVMPKFSEAVLNPWGEIYPGLTTGVPDLGIIGRGIPEANLREARVGWDMDENRVIIPHFWKGDLVGWQARRIIEDDLLYPEKYKSTGDFPRDRTLYRPPTGKRIIVVESPMSTLRHMHHLPMASTFGSALSEPQIRLLQQYPEIIFWVDNDPAGWKTVEGTWDDRGAHTPGPAELLTAYSDVKVVPSDWVGDPAEIDDETAEELVAAAVPLWLYERPSILRCMVCRLPHGGPCA